MISFTQPIEFRKKEFNQNGTTATTLHSLARGPRSLLTSGPLGEEPKVSDEGAAMQTLCLLVGRKWRVDSNPVVVRMALGVLAAVACLGADAANRHAVRATFSTHQLERKTS